MYAHATTTDRNCESTKKKKKEGISILALREAVIFLLYLYLRDFTDSLCMQDNSSEHWGIGIFLYFSHEMLYTNYLVIFSAI